MLPELVDVGQRDALLPVGIHQASPDEIVARFVDTEPQYAPRVELWRKYEAFRTMVAGFVPIQHEYLNGSFVTSTAAPKNTEVSFWVNASDLDALTPDQQAAWEQLWSQRLSVYGCDAVLVTPCPPSHPAHGEFVAWRDQTETSWPAYKNRAKVVVPGVVKGYVEVVR